jgi:hypothetical protein
MEHCASCHNVWPYRWTEPNKYGKRFILVGLTPQSYVGTDRTQSEAARPFAITGDVRKYFPLEFREKEILPTRLYFVLLRNAVIETALKELARSAWHTRISPTGCASEAVPAEDVRKAATSMRRTHRRLSAGWNIPTCPTQSNARSRRGERPRPQRA